MGGGAAMYVAFGRAAGWMSARGMAGGPPDRRGGFGRGPSPGPGGPPSAGSQGADAGDYRYVDIHGAGAQRSDPKVGDPAMFPHGRGPQGDVIRIYNHVRLVRGGNVVRRTETASALPPTTAPARAEESSGPPGGPAIGGPRQPASPIIAALDSNGDGVIAEDEIKNASAVLKKLDKNGDGKLTMEEIRPQGMGGPGGPGFRGDRRGPGGPPPGEGQDRPQRLSRQRPPSDQ